MIIYFSGKLYIFSKFNSMNKEKLVLSIWLSKSEKFDFPFNEVKKFIENENWKIFECDVTDENKKIIKKCMKSFIIDVNKKITRL